jgi:hypothetical protein
MPPKKKQTEKVDNEIINFYEHKDIENPNYPNPNFDKHQMKTPFYTLICASSGSGKTNMLLNLIRRMDNTFSHIYIVNQEEEPLYALLQKTITKGLTITTKFSDLPSIEEFGKDKDNQKLIILDDQLFSKHEQYINTLFKRGRKLGISTIFITQSFYDTNKFIRKQIHYLILLSIGGKRDLDAILRTYNFGDIDDDVLRKIFKSATDKHLDFLKIDVRNRDINRKFSRNFTEFYQLEDMDSDDDV